MPETPTGVVYYVDGFGSPQNMTGRREKWVRGSNQVTEIVQVAWVNWEQFRKDMIGTARWVIIPGGGGGSFLSRDLPTPHPKYPWMIPVEVELLGIIGTPTSGANFGDFKDGEVPNAIGNVQPLTPPIAIAAVTYEARRYNFTMDDAAIASANAQYASPNGQGCYEWLRYVEWDRESEIQALAVQGSRWRWKDTHVVFNDQSNHGGVQRRFCFGQFNLQWHEVPSVVDIFHQPALPLGLLANWKFAEGYINATPFWNYDTGTLLCGAVQYKKIISPTGQWQWEVTIPLDHQPVGWNNKFRPTNAAGVFAPKFYEVEGEFGDASVPGGQMQFPPYQAAEFNVLLFSAQVVSEATAHP